MTTIENLKYEIKHIRDPLKTKSDDWKECADQWYVTFKHDGGFFTVDYFTGSGHRKKIGARSLAKPPKIKDVIYSLYMDSSATNENFHDWCLNSGVNDDSISALNTYKECILSGQKLKKLGLTPEYLAAEFENY